jgi:putative flippase GtrA
MITFFRVQAASILGSMADYLTTIILVELFHCWYLIANLAGNICGGSLQFILSRNWVFHADKSKTGIQTIKFIVFFSGNIFLSAAGIYFFTHYLRINYIISKTLTSVLLGISYNYIMLKKFVFA